VLGPLRRVLPVLGGIDFSPLVAIVGLQALRILIA
jgi:YggT family protein